MIILSKTKPTFTNRLEKFSNTLCLTAIPKAIIVPFRTLEIVYTVATEPVLVSHDKAGPHKAGPWGRGLSYRYFGSWGPFSNTV